MENEINSLRQQVAAAEFLATQLRAQLRRAEEQLAVQNIHNLHIPQTDLTPESHAAPNATVQADRESPNDLSRTSRVTLTPHRDEQASNRQTPEQNRAHLQGLSHSRDRRNDTEDCNATYDRPVQSVDNQPADAERAVEVQPVEYPLSNGLPRLELKQILPDLGSVKSIVVSHALAQGWTAATKKRDRLRICMGCRTTDTCPYHVRAEVCEEGARISACKLGHTCAGAVHPPNRPQVSYLRFLREEVPKHIDLNGDTSTKEIQDAVFRHFHSTISLNQCSKLKALVRGKRAKRSSLQVCSICSGQGHNRQTCKA